MAKLDLPIESAVWLIDNTSLTFEQISEFCELHVKEVKAIANQEICSNLRGYDLITAGVLTKGEIERCQKNIDEFLIREDQAIEEIYQKLNPKKKRKYTTVMDRNNRPKAIYWLLQHYPFLSDEDIAKLLGATINMVNNIRSGKNTDVKDSDDELCDPVSLGLCTKDKLEKLVHEAKKNSKKKERKSKRTKRVVNKTKTAKKKEDTAKKTKAKTATKSATKSKTSTKDDDQKESDKKNNKSDENNQE